MKKIVKNSCAKASFDEIELIREELPEVSITGILIFLVPFLLVTGVYFWIIATSYVVGRAPESAIGVTAYLCSILVLGGMVIKLAVSYMSLRGGKAYVSVCKIHQLHKDSDKYWITCETKDVPGLFHIYIDDIAYYRLKADRDTQSKVVWVGLMRPCLIFID